MNHYTWTIIPACNYHNQSGTGLNKFIFWLVNTEVKFKSHEGYMTGSIEIVFKREVEQEMEGEEENVWEKIIEGKIEQSFCKWKGTVSWK